MKSGVRTIRELIYFRYAELTAREAWNPGHLPGDSAADARRTEEIYRDLLTGRWRWVDATRLGRNAVRRRRTCAFCGSDKDLLSAHLVPRTIRVLGRCRWCNRLTSLYNEVRLCADCERARGNKGLYLFFRELFPAEPKFYDFAPPVVERKYLKMVYDCHECAGTLDARDLDGDEKLTLLDVDQVVARHAR